MFEINHSMLDILKKKSEVEDLATETQSETKKE
jgi:hypothetical protein